ncbi:collagen-like protein, partial [Myxococcus sp. 1LA]
TANPTGASQAITAGGGGGACGGNGGSGGGGTTAAPQQPEPGAAGHDLRTVTPTPENVFL